MQRLTYALLIPLFAYASATAQVVDFEDIAVAPGTNDIGGDRTSGGFLFDSFTNHTHRLNADFAPDNGSTHLVFDDFNGVNQVIMRQLNAADFDLETVDLSQANDPIDRATDVMFTAFYSAGGSIQQTFDIAAANNTWATYSFVGNWTGLSFVEIQGFGSSNGLNYYAIDNISLVPEPASIALLLAGLAGIAVGRRRKQRRIVAGTP